MVVGYRSVAGLGSGLRMLAVLERQVVAEVPDREVVERIQAWKALKSRVEAGLIDELLEFAWRRRCDPTAPVGVRLPAVEEFAADELAPALTLSPRTARGWFERLITLADRLPRVMAAMRAGHIDEKKGVAIFDETAHLSDDEATGVADEILKTASRKTVAQVRAQANKAAMGIRPKETEKAVKDRARRDRDVTVRDRGDGNAELKAVLESGAAAIIMGAVNNAAWQAKRADPNPEGGGEGGEGGGRFIGECRAAALLDLIIDDHTPPEHTNRPDNDRAEDADSDSTGSDGTGTGSDGTGSDSTGSDGTGSDGTGSGGDGSNGRGSQSDPGATASGRGGRGGAKSIVNVTISLAEFLKLFHALRDGHHLGEGLEEQPCSGGVGEIDGLGFVPAWVARNLVADLIEHKSTGFRAVVFDENTGTFLAASSPSYRLPADLERHIKHRDRTCRFPGCRQPATWCDIDHSQAWQTADRPPTAT